MTVQEIVQHPLLTHVKDSVVTVPAGTPPVPARDSHVFPYAPYMDSSLQTQPSISLAIISLVFLGSSHVSQRSAAHFLWQATHFQIFTSYLSHFLCLFSCRSLLYITCFQNSSQTVLRPPEKFMIQHHMFLALNGKPCTHKQYFQTEDCCLLPGTADGTSILISSQSSPVHYLICWSIQ